LDILRFTRTYRTARRLQQIVNVFLKHGFGTIIDQINLGRFIPFRQRFKTFGKWPALRGPTMAERLRMAFAELGPSFIKLAQILSSRPDLITARYAEEFKKLQDEVPPFPAAEARRIVEEEVRLPLGRVFSRFDDAPVAAASIAQVHNATLADGTDVIVKVQRPDIREVIETDIDIMTTLARLLERHVTESIGDVYIPKVFPEFLTENVIVMERIEGVRIDDIKGIERLGLDRRELASVGVNAYFKMILEDGFFHGDPHPGNIFAMPSGQIGFVDFGIVGRVDDQLKETMANTFLALIKKDFDKLIDQYIELGLVPEDIDLEEFRRAFKSDLKDFLEPIYGMTLKEINFAEYLDTVTHLAMKHNLKIPSDLLLINKSMLILENLGLELDPDFDFIAAAEPYASKLARERFSPSRLYEDLSKTACETGDFVLNFPRQMKRVIRKVLRDDISMKLKHEGLEHFIRDMDRSSNRIAFAMVISAFILSSALMHATGVRPTIFGMSVLGFVSFGVASLLGIWLIISIIRSGRL